MCNNIKDSGTVEKIGSSTDAASLVDSLYFPAIREADDKIQSIRRARCETGCVPAAFIHDSQPHLSVSFNWRTRQFDGKAAVTWSAERQCDPAPPPPEEEPVEEPPIEEPVEEPPIEEPVEEPPIEEPEEPEQPQACGAPCNCGGTLCNVAHAHCPNARFEPLGCLGRCTRPPRHGGPHNCSKHNHPF